MANIYDETGFWAAPDVWPFVLMQLTTAERIATGTKQRSELMLTELKAVPDSANTYKSVGKA